MGWLRSRGSLSRLLLALVHHFDPPSIPRTPWHSQRRTHTDESHSAALTLTGKLLGLNSEPSGLCMSHSCISARLLHRNRRRTPTSLRGVTDTQCAPSTLHAYPHARLSPDLSRTPNHHHRASLSSAYPPMHQDLNTDASEHFPNFAPFLMTHPHPS